MKKTFAIVRLVVFGLVYNFAVSGLSALFFYSFLPYSDFLRT